MHKPLFITFEGGEGSGKTTLLKKMQAALEARGYLTLATRAPGGTALGAEIRELLLHKKTDHLCKKAELFLFVADRAQHTQEVILPALKEGKIVLCDRFNDSTIAYQGAARHADLVFVEDLCNYAVSGLEPHLTFYLDIEPLEGLQRAKKAITKDGKASYDRMESEALEFHKLVRECYLEIAKQNPTRFIVIDASFSQEKVFDRAMDELSNWIQHS